MTFFEHFRIAYRMVPLTPENNRLSRADFTPLAVIAAISLVSVLVLYGTMPRMLAMPFMFACVHLILFPTFIGAVRRMHDTGRSGFKLALPLYAMGFSALIDLANNSRFSPGTAGFLDDRVVYGAAIAVTLCAVTVTMLRLLSPGQPGPNRFGPDPCDHAGSSSPAL